jgi:hypothetical protein
MTLYQLIVEFKHLFGGHAGEGHGEAKPEGGEAPASPAPSA